MRHRPTFRRWARAGLSLLELVVVLAILATLTTVATVAVLPTVDASRHEATRRTLEDIRDASEGRRGTAGVVTGFAADVGELPTALAQLTSSVLPAGLTPWASRSSAVTLDGATGTIALPGGWRGPYLRLGVGQAAITDGWGDAFVVSGGAGADTQVITIAHEAPYAVPFGFGAGPVPVPALTVPTTVALRFATDPGTVVRAIAIRGPDPAVGAELRSEAELDPRPDPAAQSETMTGRIGPGLRAIVLALDRDGDLVAEAPLVQRDVVIPLPPAATIDLGIVR